MENNIHPLPSVPVYRLPEREYVLLERLRTQWGFLASLYCPQTPEEEGTPLEISRATLADGFAEFARQLDDILRVIRATSPRPRQ